MTEEEEEAKILNIPIPEKKKNKKRKRNSNSEARMFTLKHCETLTLTKKEKKFQTRKGEKDKMAEEEETKALNSIPEKKKNKKREEIKFRGCRLCSAHGGLPPLLPPNCNPLIIIQIPGKKGMHPSTRQISLLSSFGFTGIFTAIFMKPLVGVMNFLQTMEPYVTYGYPNLKSIKELVYKKGHANINDQKVPLTDNIIEQELGQFGIVCKEDMVSHIANIGPHFSEVATFMWPFELNNPSDGLRGSKTLYKDGGDAGNRKDSINELINKMMN